ncbi:MAG: imelysin family protein [Ferrovibrio sp.]|uniref:imelysin family protein n=1 Tax=Ferrovibrio sp. TaxID=1917215 RepID=UPI002603F370|nr:imelysin family protein [Ferrovibrio sp.]MCW0236452.1 imelysin family protein [Ferrovibrio sp.]
MRFIASAALAALLAFAAAPVRAVEADTYAALNKAAVETHILPRYDALVTATAALDGAAKTYCAAPAAKPIADLQGAFGQTMDAWQDIQHVRFGPVDWFFRSQRFAFWPDPRNTIGKQMAELLARHQAGSVDVELLARGSVATQGLPALERLIFGDDAGKLKTGPEAAYRCRYVEAIAANLAQMAKETRAGWRDGGDKAFAAVMLDTSKPDAPYREAQEATLELFKALYLAVELASDHKLARPLGAAIKDARPRLAESWRSQRSLRNIRRNIAAARDLYLTGFAAGISDQALDATIRDGFAKSLAAADTLKQPLEVAVADRAGRPQAEKLAAELVALKKLLGDRLPAALDIPVGFNALDGD